MKNRAIVKHRAIINLTPEIVLMLLTVGYKTNGYECVDGLPRGAILTNAFINPDDNLELHFDHPDFPEVEEGKKPTHIICPAFTAKI